MINLNYPPIMSDKAQAEFEKVLFDPSDGLRFAPRTPQEGRDLQSAFAHIFWRAWTTATADIAGALSEASSLGFSWQIYKEGDVFILELKTDPYFKHFFTAEGTADLPRVIRERIHPRKTEKERDRLNEELRKVFKVKECARYAAF